MSEEHYIEDKKAPLAEHLLELRNRLLYAMGGLLIAFIVSYMFAEDIYGYLVRPLAEAYEGETGRRLIYTGLTEAFFTYIKVAFYTALFVSFPIIAMQIYIFLAPGLYKKEKRVLLPFLVGAPILFVAGGAMVYYFIFPMAWQFFLSFESNVAGALPIQLEARVSEYLGLVIHLIFAFGIAFQLPIVLTLLAKVGLVTPESLASKRKYAIVGIVICAAVITPPDVISQIGLALPLYLLYEFSIIMCRWMQKPQTTEVTNEKAEEK